MPSHFGRAVGGAEAGRYTIAISWFLCPCRRAGDLELEGVAGVSGCYPVGVRLRCWSNVNPGSYSTHFNGGRGGQQHQECPFPLCIQVFSKIPVNIYPISNLWRILLVWNLWSTCVIQGTVLYSVGHNSWWLIWKTCNRAIRSLSA